MNGLGNSTCNQKIVNANKIPYCFIFQWDWATFEKTFTMPLFP